MMTTSTAFERMLSFLQGASWSLVILLSATLFYYNIFYGLLYAIMSAVIGAIIGFMFVAFFELIFININKQREIEKQTKILKEILEKLSNN